jgi:hypothetical protein
MTYADPTQRTALIGGLRTLADYLESNPEVPAPIFVDVLTFPSAGDWSAMHAEIDVIASRLTVIASDSYGGHYVASRFFGPVEYRAVAIPRRDNDESE